ncbi:MAG: hypothetical protein JO360_10950, partial [Acidobacteria bacterium]|nr:hypothetical protein [Acidobacteriota bacterium]
MRFLSFSKLLSACALVICSFAPVLANGATEEAAKLLPDQIGTYRAVTKAEPDKAFSESRQRMYHAISSASRTYRSEKGEYFALTVTRMSSEAGAYAWLTTGTRPVYAIDPSTQVIRTGEVGTASM